ncbi:MAG: DUF554 domain-containing protein [Leptolinea sp.]|mgnify:CR=1 FL=1|nr:DUF554 domain-containing protein [Leptolinea sp.]
MTGSLLNAGAIVVGGLLGLLLGSRLPEKMKQSVLLILGIFTLLYGIQMFLETENALIPLLSILAGVMVGEWVDLETRLKKLASIWEERFSSSTKNSSISNDGTHGFSQNRLMQGFITTSLIYCSGPMSILGAIQNGLTGDISTLTVKSILDGFASLAFASSLGVGVVFSSIPVLVYQGSIAIFAGQIQRVLTTSMINELTAVGGIILVSLAISSFLEIKTVRTVNLLPALLLVPFFTWLFELI